MRENKNSFLRPLTEAERATIRRLLLEYMQAAAMAKEAIEQHLIEIEKPSPEKTRGLRSFRV